MPRKISPEQLIPLIGTADCPIIVDVRREQAFRSSATRIAGAIWRDHMASWRLGARDLPAGRPVGRLLHPRPQCQRARGVAACGEGVDVSRARRRDRSLRRRRRAVGGARGTGRGCHARQAERLGDARAAEDRSHRLSLADPPLHRSARGLPFRAGRLGRRTSPRSWARSRSTSRACTIRIAARPARFDTLIAEFAIADPALAHLARIVRGADTARLDLEPQSAGLLGDLARAVGDRDRTICAQLEAGMPIYDALYGWCRHATEERHNWPAKAAAA